MGYGFQTLPVRMKKVTIIVDRLNDMIITGGVNVYPVKSRKSCIGCQIFKMWCPSSPGEKWGRLRPLSFLQNADLG